LINAKAKSIFNYSPLEIEESLKEMKEELGMQ
jgi:hypothetical protein